MDASPSPGGTPCYKTRRDRGKTWLSLGGIESAQNPGLGEVTNGGHASTWLARTHGDRSPLLSLSALEVTLAAGRNQSGNGKEQVVVEEPPGGSGSSS
ncbi:hypothetical protein MRX96_027816 [Rhipicephalus microplus]